MIYNYHYTLDNSTLCSFKALAGQPVRYTYAVFQYNQQLQRNVYLPTLKFTNKRGALIIVQVGGFLRNNKRVGLDKGM